MSSELRAPGWEVIREGDSGLLKCKGRIPGYQPIYLEGGDFTDKLIMHTHNEIRHFGIANNRPLTYVESEQEEEQVLTPNTILWGQNVHTIDESDTDDGE